MNGARFPRSLTRLPPRHRRAGGGANSKCANVRRGLSFSPVSIASRVGECWFKDVEPSRASALTSCPRMFRRCARCVLLKGCQKGYQGTIFAPSSSGAVAVLAVLAVMIRSAATAATVWDRFLLLCVPGVSMEDAGALRWGCICGGSHDDLLTNMAHERLPTSDPCLDSSLEGRNEAAMCEIWALFCRDPLELTPLNSVAPT